TAHGFKVVAEQRVAARGEWFINYRMESAGR
ncbi:TPA: GNAT family N-acetyltransferase, partial [Klebsiella quasipneumoniae]